MTLTSRLAAAAAEGFSVLELMATRSGQPLYEAAGLEGVPAGTHLRVSDIKCVPAETFWPPRSDAW